MDTHSGVNGSHRADVSRYHGYQDGEDRSSSDVLGSGVLRTALGPLQQVCGRSEHHTGNVDHILPGLVLCQGFGVLQLAVSFLRQSEYNRPYISTSCTAPNKAKQDKPCLFNYDRTTGA